MNIIWSREKCGDEREWQVMGPHSLYPGEVEVESRVKG